MTGTLIYRHKYKHLADNLTPGSLCPFNKRMVAASRTTAYHFFKHRMLTHLSEPGVSLIHKAVLILTWEQLSVSLTIVPLSKWQAHFTWHVGPAEYSTTAEMTFLWHWDFHITTLSLLSMTSTQAQFLPLRSLTVVLNGKQSWDSTICCVSSEWG